MFLSNWFCSGLYLQDVHEFGLGANGQVGQKISQTGLALMGFSRSCPSSLDLTNFMVQSCRGAVPRPSRDDSLESGNPGIWKSGIQKIPNMKILRIRIRSARNVGRVLMGRKQNLLAPSRAISGKFSVDQTNRKKDTHIFSLVGQWALFTWFGVMVSLYHWAD